MVLTGLWIPLLFTNINVISSAIFEVSRKISIIIGYGVRSATLAIWCLQYLSSSFKPSISVVMRLNYSLWCEKKYQIYTSSKALIFILRTSDLPNHWPFYAQHPCRSQNMEKMNTFEKRIWWQTFQDLFCSESQSVQPWNKNSNAVKVGYWSIKGQACQEEEGGGRSKFTCTIWSCFLSFLLVFNDVACVEAWVRSVSFVSWDFAKYDVLEI